MNTVQALDYALELLDRERARTRNGALQGSIQEARNKLQKLRNREAPEAPDTPETVEAKFSALRRLLDRMEYP